MIAVRCRNARSVSIAKVRQIGIDADRIYQTLQYRKVDRFIVGKSRKLQDFPLIALQNDEFPISFGYIFDAGDISIVE